MDNNHSNCEETPKKRTIPSIEASLANISEHLYRISLTLMNIEKKIRGIDETLHKARVWGGF